MVNVDDPAAVDDGLLAASDGVGLLRTEFLFLGRERPSDEEEQHRAYAGLRRRGLGPGRHGRPPGAGAAAPVRGAGGAGAGQARGSPPRLRRKEARA